MTRSAVRVLAHPHIEEANAYLGLLAKALQAAGVRYEGWSWRALLRHPVDILHVHWPELAVGPRKTAAATVKLVEFLVLITVCRLRRIPVVWTVHNVASHERWHPVLERVLYLVWTRSVAGVISLSESALQEAQRRYPRLQHIPSTVVGHGAYEPIVGDKQAARTDMGVDVDRRLLLHFGHLREYKGTVDLLDAVQGLDADTVVLVAGRVRPPELANVLSQSVHGQVDVRLELHQLSAEELRTRLLASDVVVLPYRRVWHSGSVLQALAARRPVITSDDPGMLELAHTVGQGWVRTVPTPLTPDSLRRALRSIERDPPTGVPNLAGQDWERIADRTVRLFEAVRSRSSTC